MLTRPFVHILLIGLVLLGCHAADTLDHGAKDIPATLEWETYVAQGCLFGRLIELGADQADAAYAEIMHKPGEKLQSTFTYDQLEGAGWTSHDNACNTKKPEDEEDIFDWDGNPAIMDFMIANNFDLTPHWEDDENGEPGGNFVVDTVLQSGEEEDEDDDDSNGGFGVDAHFKNIYNTDGLIVAWDLRSPQTVLTEKQQAGEETDGLRVPKLNKWSDVAFLEWQGIANREHVEVNSLRSIVWPHISNRATMDVIFRAISGKHNARCPEGDEIPGLDGYREKDIFPIESEEGRALLATPLGKGAAYMLMQHKSDLGSLQIHSFEVWREPDNGSPCMAVMFEGYSGGQKDVEMSDKRSARL